MEMSFSRLLLNICNGFSNGLLLCSLSFSLSIFNQSYNRYLFASIVILLLFFLLSILFRRIQLNLYFSCLWRLFIGILLGLQAINYTSKESYINYTDLDSTLLYISLLFYSIYIILFIFTVENKQEFVIFLKPEILETLGLLLVQLLYKFDVSAIIILMAQIISITSINFKSFQALFLHLILNLFIILYFYPNILHISINNLFMIGFIFRISFHPVIKLFEISSSFQRWSIFFNLNKYLRKIFILLIIVVLIAFPAVNALTIASHKEWFIVVPLFIFLLIMWIIFHFTLIIMCWKLSNKITEYKLTISNNIVDGSTMQKVMTSNGLRFFSLLAHRISLLSHFSSILICLVCWETRSAISISLAIAILPLEVSIKSMFNVLTNQLSGTCAGYAVITPQYIIRDEITLLPSGFNEEINNLSLKLSTKLQSFFNWHMIDNVGCDYLSSGIALNHLKLKISDFFNCQTPNHLFYDTYLLLYAGSSDDIGNWALLGKEYLSIESILEIWRCSPSSLRSRLIIVCENNGPSFKTTLLNYKDIFVAIQTSQTTVNDDKLEPFCPYTYITNWIDFNALPALKQSLNGVTFKSSYFLSPSWPNFQFRSLTDVNICDMSDSFHISRAMSNCITAFDSVLKFLDICDCFKHFMNRIKIKLMPPKMIDTKHGFFIITTN